MGVERMVKRAQTQEQNLYAAHVCKVTFKKSPQTPQKSYPNVWNPSSTFEFPPLCPAKYSIVRGEGDVPEVFFELSPNIFVN